MSFHSERALQACKNRIEVIEDILKSACAKLTPEQMQEINIPSMEASLIDWYIDRLKKEVMLSRPLYKNNKYISDKDNKEKMEFFEKEILRLNLTVNNIVFTEDIK